MLRAAGVVLRVPRHVKKKWQPVADAVGAYGTGVLDLYDIPRNERYECFVALAWGAQRQRTRFSISVTQGIVLATTQNWPAEVFKALATTDEEGEFLHRRHAALAAMDAAMQRN